MMKRLGMLFLILTCIFLLSGCNSKSEKNTSAKRTAKIEEQGGLRITYKTVEINPSSKDMEDTIYKLQKRAEIYNTEAEVHQKGERYIIVEIPGVTDADEIQAEFGRSGSLEFVAAKADGMGGETVLTGKDIKNAKAVKQKSSTGTEEYVVQLTLTKEGAKTFGEVTKQNIGKKIWIMYDEQQISAPTVQSAIYNGDPCISGLNSYEEAEELAVMLRIGALEVELEEVESEIFSPD